MRSFTALTVSAALASSVLASSHSNGAHIERRSQPGWIKRRVDAGRRAVGADSSLLIVGNSSANATAPTWYNGTALWFEATGGQSACYTVTTNDDLIVGLGTDLWPDSGIVSPLCGQKMFIKNTDTGANVTVTIQDASAKNYTTLSKAAFLALGDLVTGMLPIEYYVLGNTTLASVPVVAAASVSGRSSVARTAVKTATSTSTSSSTPSSTSTYVAPSTTSTPTPTPSPTTTIDYAAIAAASSVSSASAASVWWAEQQASSASSVSSVSAASLWAAQQWSSSTAAAAAASAAAAAESASSLAAVQAAAVVVPSPTPTPAASSDSTAGLITGGQATYYMQNGNPGNCGDYNSDSSYIVALETSTYAGGAHCGKKIQIVNLSNGKSATATVADSCPTCGGPNYIDLSQGLFGYLTDNNFGQGVFDLGYKFL